MKVKRLFNNKDNSLNEYALSCGYCEKTYFDLFEKYYITMYKEHNTYFVYVCLEDKTYFTCFEYLKDARRYYKKNKGKFHA